MRTTPELSVTSSNSVPMCVATSRCPLATSTKLHDVGTREPGLNISTWGVSVTEAIESTSIGPAAKSVIAPEARSTRQMLRPSEAQMLRLSSPDLSRSVEDGDEDASIVR